MMVHKVFMPFLFVSPTTASYMYKPYYNCSSHNEINHYAWNMETKWSSANSISLYNTDMEVATFGKFYVSIIYGSSWTR